MSPGTFLRLPKKSDRWSRESASPDNRDERVCRSAARFTKHETQRVHIEGSHPRLHEVPGGAPHDQYQGWSRARDVIKRAGGFRPRGSKK